MNINFFDQVQASSGLPNSNHEICYCILDTSASGYAYSQGFNNLGTEGCGPSYSYRNSYLGPPDVNGTATGNGPFQYESDAIQWGSPFSQAVYANKTAGALPAAVTNLNPECQAQSGIFTNPAGGDYSFQSAYSAFTGLRGAGIS